MINDLFIDIIEYINDHLYDEISVDELADHFGYEKSYFMKSFKKEIGMPIKSYINNRKIMSVLNDLKYDDSLLKIALNHGFNSLEYFSEIFSKEVGVSPSTYRKFLNNSCSLEDKILIEDYLIELQKLNIALLKYRRSIKETKSLSFNFE